MPPLTNGSIHAYICTSASMSHPAETGAEPECQAQVHLHRFMLYLSLAMAQNCLCGQERGLPSGEVVFNKQNSMFSLLLTPSVSGLARDMQERGFQHPKWQAWQPRSPSGASLRVAKWFPQTGKRFSVHMGWVNSLESAFQPTSLPIRHLFPCGKVVSPNREVVSHAYAYAEKRFPCPGVWEDDSETMHPRAGP